MRWALLGLNCPGCILEVLFKEAGHFCSKLFFFFVCFVPWIIVFPIFYANFAIICWYVAQYLWNFELLSDFDRSLQACYIFMSSSFFSVEAVGVNVLPTIRFRHFDKSWRWVSVSMMSPRSEWRQIQMGVGPKNSQWCHLNEVDICQKSLMTWRRHNNTSGDGRNTPCFSH